MAQEADNKK